jgi:hypothetical protein
MRKKVFTTKGTKFGVLIFRTLGVLRGEKMVDTYRRPTTHKEEKP